MSANTAFTQKLDAASLEYFSNLAKEPFSKQAVQFLNAYWSEVGDQAPFIFHVAYEMVKACDMHFKGISLIHLYDEGNDMDFNCGLYFYEKLGLKVLESPEGRIWREDPKFKPSMPQMMTAIVRKQELREKVDVNFDGRVSFLEYLLYQYREFCNPADFCERSMRQEGEHPEITRARLLLDDVNQAIRAYEREKTRLQEESQLPGVRGLTAKHTFAQLSSSPLAEKLSTAFIKAEAALRKANKLFGGEVYDGSASRGQQSGAMFWMNADLEQKKALYGRRAVAGHAIVGSRTTSAPATVKTPPPVPVTTKAPPPVPSSANKQAPPPPPPTKRTGAAAVPPPLPTRKQQQPVTEEKELETQPDEQEAAVTEKMDELAINAEAAAAEESDNTMIEVDQQQEQEAEAF